MRIRFERVIDEATGGLGTSYGVVMSLLVVAAWAISFPLWGNPGLLAINTITTVVTFATVFTIHASTNRESRVLMLKLDELLSRLCEGSPAA